MSEVNFSLYAKSKVSKLNIILNILIAVIAVALIFEVAFAARYSGIYVIGSSMETTLHGAGTTYSGGYEVADIYGDYVYVDRYAKPERGDIVVIFKDKTTTIIKRVIALEGDCVKIENGKLYIKYSGSDKFELKDEPYVDKALDYGADQSEHEVAEGCMFVLGDHRKVSVDSRYYGDFALTSLYGVVTDWSVKNKTLFTGLHKYFSFDLPACFGIDNRVKTVID